MNVGDKIAALKPEGRAYINGENVAAADGSVISRLSSYDGGALPELAACGQIDVDRAVGAAQTAYQRGYWRNLSLQRRCEIVLRLADLMEQHKEELALLDTLETSRAWRNYFFDSIPKAIDAVRYYAQAADKQYGSCVRGADGALGLMESVPLGVVGIITPWNDPLVVAAWKFTPALLMGNSVVVKPAEQSSLSMLRVAALAAEAGVPTGVLNVVPGYGESAGKALALHPQVRGIFFTGSTATGKTIMQYAGQSNLKKVGLECGGKSPFIVSDKCGKLKECAQILAQNVFYNQGQICTAPSRALVQEESYEEFLSYLKEAAEQWVPGNPYDELNKVGCVVSSAQYERVMGYLELAKQEAQEVWQARTLKDKALEACCIQPAIISGVEPEACVAREEIFGPVVTLLKYRDLKEAVALANDSEYGLAAAIFTDDMNEANYAVRQLESGLVHVNSYGEDEVNTPFGGFKQSGLGKDRSVWAFEEYSELKTVWWKFGDS